MENNNVWAHMLTVTRYTHHRYWKYKQILSLLAAAGMDRNCIDKIEALMKTCHHGQPQSQFTCNNSRSTSTKNNTELSNVPIYLASYHCKIIQINKFPRVLLKSLFLFTKKLVKQSKLKSSKKTSFTSVPGRLVVTVLSCLHSQPQVPAKMCSIPLSSA